MLKLCNRLLPRMSRASEPQLCARVLLLLAKVLPLNERSGLNMPVGGLRAGGRGMGMGMHDRQVGRVLCGGRRRRRRREGSGVARPAGPHTQRPPAHVQPALHY